MGYREVCGPDDCRNYAVREGAARALAYRGFAVGGEVFALFLPVFYYCLSRTVRDLITDIKNGFKPEYEED
ncbi:MAG: hypothetical protein V8S92_03090 [Oscillospiraceae bacterium]